MIRWWRWWYTCSNAYSQNYYCAFGSSFFFLLFIKQMIHQFYPLSRSLFGNFKIYKYIKQPIQTKGSYWTFRAQKWGNWIFRNNNQKNVTNFISRLDCRWLGSIVSTEYCREASGDLYKPSPRAHKFNTIIRSNLWKSAFSNGFSPIELSTRPHDSVC